MILIFITLIVMLAMAKTRRRRRRGMPMRNYIRGNLDLSIAGGTLAGNTALKQDVGDTVDDTTKVTSIVATHTWSGFTGGDNIGPVQVGVAHSDYSLAEISAYINLSTGWSQADLVSREISARKIRRIGTFQVEAASAGEISVLNDGKPIKTKLNWILSEGQTLAFWMFNTGSAAFATTDPDYNIFGHANLFTQ